jgi:hypothetical protein
MNAEWSSPHDTFRMAILYEQNLGKGMIFLFVLNLILITLSDLSPMKRLLYTTLDLEGDIKRHHDNL